MCPWALASAAAVRWRSRSLPTKFYLRRDASVVGGSLPGTNTTISAASATTWSPGASNSVVATPLLTNRLLSPTIGTTSQTSLAYTTDNVTTDQRQPLLRFVSEPLDAQVIPTGTNALLFTGFSNSNTASNFRMAMVVCVWRPSGGF